MRAHRSTSRHVQSAYPWVGSDATPEGVVIGQDAITGELFGYDPWLLADQGVLSGQGMTVFGRVGTAKSSLVKSLLLRSLVYDVRARVLDVKGEYLRVAAAVPGAQVVSMSVDGGVRINPLDPSIPSAHQVAVVQTLVEATAAQRMPVLSRAVLAAAVQQLRATSAEPTLATLRDSLWAPPAAVIDACGGDARRVTAAAVDAAAALAVVLGGPLAGLLGGASSIQPDPACPMLVADVSSLVALGGTEIAAAMAVVGTWLQSVLALRQGRQVILLDECWRLLADVSTARWLRQAVKLAREYQAQIITVFHRLSDLAAVGDAGSEQAQIARGLISDSETLVLYRQTRGEVQALGELLGLSDRERAVVPTLGRGVALWRVGNSATVVRHLLSSWEAPLVETEGHRRELLDRPGEEELAVVVEEFVS